jgi:hypothetical protein
MATQRKSDNAKASTLEVVKIACVDRSTVDLGVDFDKLIPALQTFLDECFVPIWGTPAKLIKASSGKPGLWNMVLKDKVEHFKTSTTEGDHITWKGMPLAKVYVEPTLLQKDLVSVTACHELCEMLVDPMATLWCEGPRSTMWAYEVCDAVEEETFDVDGITMSDFVFPSYFELFRLQHPGSAQYDYLKRVERPFQILKKGYSLIRHNRRAVEKTGSSGKAKRFALEDRRGHRNQFRKRRRANW